MIECVINISEGKNPANLTRLLEACGSALLDVHSDAHHNRSVFTMAGPDVEMAARSLTSTALEILNLDEHDGAHPRFGIVDVVPFVPLGDTHIDDAMAARNRFAEWAGSELKVPCFLYGPERSLPNVRKDAFGAIKPDFGPSAPHPTAGAIAVGVRPILVAYNLWMKEADLVKAESIADEIRGKHIRALGLQVGEHVQVSCNLLAPDVVGPMYVYDAVSSYAPIGRAELVGLIPATVYMATPYERREELDITEDKTIEARLAKAGFGNL